MSCFRLIQTVTMFSLLLSMLFWPQLSFGGSQAEAVQDDRTAEVNALIRELRDPKFVVREAASQKLAEIGMPAVPALNLAAKSESLEVQVRAKSILSRIQLGRGSSLGKIDQATVKQFVAADPLGRVAILKTQASSKKTKLFLRLLDICVVDEERASSGEDGIESAIEELIVVEVDNPLITWIAELLNEQRWDELNKLVTHPGIIKYSPMLRASKARNAGKFDAYVEDRYQKFSQAQAAQETLSTRELISLIGLLRVQRDFDRAEKVIVALPDVDLQRRLHKELLFQQGNWKEILRRTKLDPAAAEFIPANLLQQAFLNYLLGDQAAIAWTERELRQQLNAVVEVAGEENTSAARLLKNDLRRLGAMTLNWPLLKEFLAKDNLAENVSLMSALNRHDEVLELLNIGPRFKDRHTWVQDTLKEISEAQKTLKGNIRGRRDPEYNRLVDLIGNKEHTLDAVFDIVEQRGGDDEAHLYCQMMFAASDSWNPDVSSISNPREKILSQLARLGRIKEYWQLVELHIKNSSIRRYSGPYWYGITDRSTMRYAAQWADGIRPAIVDPVEKNKRIAAIMNSPWVDREAMDFDLDYEMARLRTLSTMDSSGATEFLMGKVFELHGEDEAADSLLKQAAQLGYSSAINAQFDQAMAEKDLYGMLEEGTRTENCLLAEEAALKLLETETDPEKIRLIKKRLNLCHLAITAQWADSSYWSRRRFKNLIDLDDLDRSQLARLHLQCLVYGVSGNFVHKESHHRQLGHVLLTEGSDEKQQSAIELATVMFNDLNYATGTLRDDDWRSSSIFLNIALGKGMIESKEYDRAADFLVRTAEFSLGDVSVGEGTIKVLAEAGAVEEADRVYRAIEKYYVETLKDYPDSPLARNNFAWLSAISNRNLESARRHASVAVKVRPHVENYWDTFAEIEFLLGKPKEAVELSKRCIQLSPGRFYYRQQKERFRRAMGEAE